MARGHKFHWRHFAPFKLLRVCSIFVPHRQPSCHWQWAGLYWHDHGYSPATSAATRSSHGARASSLRINLRTSLMWWQVEPPLVRSGRATNSSSESESHAAVAARLRVPCTVLAPGSFNLVCQCQCGALSASGSGHMSRCYIIYHIF